MRTRSVLDWLLEEGQPSARYFTLVDLLGRKETDPEVKRARSRIPRVGWAADQLRRQGPKGFFERREPKTMLEWMNFLWDPKFGSTMWRGIVLADLGMDRSDPRIRKIAELIFHYKLRLSCPFNFFHEEMCIVGNTARMLTRFGYGDDPRVGRLFTWMLEDQRADGGWNCSQATPGTLDVWEPLAALAAIPPRERTPRMRRAIENGAEFYLKRRLFREGRRYAPWLRLHYPNHYFYDVLVGLDLLTRLGYGDDRRLAPALDLLNKRRQRDGTWVMGELNPDIREGRRTPRKNPHGKPLQIERPGQPSKWITLTALRVQQRVERAT